MDELELDFRFVARFARRAIHQYDVALEATALQSQDATSSSLLNRLKAELADYKAQIDAREDKFAFSDSENRSVFTAALRTRATELAQMAAPVAWCQRDFTPEPSLAQLDFAQQAATAVVQGPCEIIAVPNADIGYATPVPIKHWNAAMPEGALEPVVVFVPPHEMRATTMLPLLVHEVGHTAIRTNLLLQRIKDVSGDGWNNAVDEAATAMSTQTGTARAAAFIQCDEILQRWTVELICDALATAYCGPCYLFAFAGAVLGREIDAPGETHPPPSERVNAMLLLLSKMGCNPLEASASTELAVWLKHIANASLKLDDRTERLLRQCSLMHHLIHDTVLAHLGDNAFQPDCVTSDVSEMLDRRVVVAAHNNSGTYVDRRAILHAAWEQIFSSSYWGGAVPDAILRSLDDIEYQEILDRSIELSYVVERWGHI